MKWFLRLIGMVHGALVAPSSSFASPIPIRRKCRPSTAAPPSQMVEIADGRLGAPARRRPARCTGHRAAAWLECRSAYMAALGRCLSDDYRVIRFDQRGHGLTGPAGDGDYTLTAFGARYRRGNRCAGRRALRARRQFDGRCDCRWVTRLPIPKGSRAGPGRCERRADPACEAEGNHRVHARRDAGWALANEPDHAALAGERSLTQSVSNQAIVTDRAVDRYWELARYPGNRAATRQRFSTRGRASPPRSRRDEVYPRWSCGARRTA